MSVFMIVRGVGGPCLVLDGKRIAGPKPLGGGPVEATFSTGDTYVAERTCRIEFRDQNESDPVGIMTCSECDSCLESCSNAAYCPWCGAKVVD